MTAEHVMLDEAVITCERCCDSGIIGYRYVDATGKQLHYLKCDCPAASSSSRAGGLQGYTHKTFDAFIAYPQIAAHVTRCRDYAAEPSGWLLLSGTYGTGKSHLAMAIANAAAQRGAGVYFATTPDLLSDLKATFDGGPETFSTRFERIRNVELLVLDDFGTEQSTAWNSEKIFQLVNHRYQRSMPTVITTNIPLAQLNGRIASRLKDTVLVEKLDFNRLADYRTLSFAERKNKELQ